MLYYNVQGFTACTVEIVHLLQYAPTARQRWKHWLHQAWSNKREATKYGQAKQLVRQANLSFTKYVLRLSRADLRILTGLLIGHADLNRHLTLRQIWTDAVCPLCQEDKETVLHFLGECSTLSAKCKNILGCPNLGYEELGKVHWRTIWSLQKPLSDSNPLGDVGLCIGLTWGLSADGNISPQRRKKERRPQ